MRDGGAYGCAVPRAYANLNPGLGSARDLGVVNFSLTVGCQWPTTWRQSVAQHIGLLSPATDETHTAVFVT